MTVPLPFVLATQNADKAHEILEIFVEASGMPVAAYCIDGVGFLVADPDDLAAAIDAMPPIPEPPDVDETGIGEIIKAQLEMVQEPPAPRVR